MIFLLELLLRLLCWKKIYNEMTSFFKDKYHILDVFVVLMDVLLIIIDVSIGASVDAASFTKMLKTVRFVKLFRILRAARLISSIGNKSILHSSERVKKLVATFQSVGLIWFLLSGLIIPAALGDNEIGDR